MSNENSQNPIWMSFNAGFTIGILTGYFMGYIVVNFSLLAWKLAFFVFAAAGVSFHTLFAFEVHEISTEGKTKSWLFHQYLLNFVGSLIGWGLLYYLLFIRLRMPLNTTHYIAWEDLLTLLVASVGVTGYLPYVVLTGKIFSKP